MSDNAINETPNLWTWRTDPATSQRALRPWIAVTFFSYLIGAALLVGAMAFQLPQQMAATGAVFILLAVLAAAAVTGKVLVDRGRTTWH